MENSFRTFIGLPLRVDEGFLEARRELMKALARERISWTNPEQYHVTLRFIGDTNQSAIRKIRNALHKHISVPEKISLETGMPGSFGPSKGPRVIWVGFKETGFFESVKSGVDHVLDLCDIPPNEHPFRAHLTLGRVRNLQNLQNYYNTLESMDQKFSTSVLFEKLVFFRSILGPGGPEYQILEEIPFRQDLSSS